MIVIYIFNKNLFLQSTINLCKIIACFIILHRDLLIKIQDSIQKIKQPCIVFWITATYPYVYRYTRSEILLLLAGR